MQPLWEGLRADAHHWLPGGVWASMVAIGGMLVGHAPIEQPEYDFYFKAIGLGFTGVGALIGLGTLVLGWRRLNFEMDEARRRRGRER